MTTLDKISSDQYHPEPPKIIVDGLYHETDRGNAERFRDLHKNKVKYCYPFRSWMMWDGKRWKIDDEGKIFQYARETIDAIFDEACRLEGERRKKLLTFGFHSESTSSIKNMLEQAQSQEEIPVSPGKFDTDKMKFNVQNGTVNLKTGEIEPHNINDFITKISPVIYNEKAECPVWKAFLKKTFQNNESLIEYHQRLCGYVLTGSTREESFDIFYGTGQNGKSRYTGQIIHILGEYHVKINIETLQETANLKSGNEASSDVAVLAGARLVTVSEPSKGMVLNEQRIKDWTGRDPITARPIYQKPFTFIPEFKVFMYTNHKPIVKTQGLAIWRRLKLSPFENTIEEHEKDKDLDLKLLSESSGILNWMIEGCLKWQKSGLSVPESIIAATEEYKDEMDTLSDFIKDCCDISDSKSESYTLPIYIIYKSWAAIKQIDFPFKQKGFPMALEERGYKKLKKDDVGIRIKGIKLFVSLSEMYESHKPISGGWKPDDQMNLTQSLETFLYSISRGNVSNIASNSSDRQENGLLISNSHISIELMIRRIIDKIKTEYGSGFPSIDGWEMYKNEVKQLYNISDETASMVIEEATKMYGKL